MKNIPFFLNFFKVLNYYLFIFFFICISVESSQAQNDTDLFDYWKYQSDIENSLYKYFCSVAFDQLNLRKTEINKLKTKSDWLEKQSKIKKRLKKVIGPFPERTPLNVQITGIIKKDGYRIEKLIYESVPGYYVTAALYIPDGVKENAPAIFYACGHSYEGFRVDIYQHIILNLVKKGFIVFTIDTMGQGERYEYWNISENKLSLTPDFEHSYSGAQCLISGYSLANIFIRDAMRGIDYMLTRKEIDPNRIGMTGRSGGGNITAYLGAIDDRILATATECYITSYEFLLKSRGPQCAEQNLYQMISKGLDHADFIMARSPKPTMIISTTRDFFSIQGTRDSYEEAKKIYAVQGSAKNLTMVEDDDKHTSTKKNREAMYAFFQKHLDNPGSSKDIELTVLDQEELKVTKTGQVVSSFDDHQSVFSMNKTIVEKQMKEIELSRTDVNKHLLNIPIAAAKISGFNYPVNFGKTIFSGRHVNSNFILEKYLIPGSGDYVLPTILLKPKGTTKNKILLLLNTKGMKHTINQDKDSIAYGLVKKGYAVLLFDLPGIGSIGPGYLKGDSYIENISYNQWFTSILAGKSFTGLRSEDILRAVHFVEDELKEFSEISAISVGALGGDLLHAATFNSNIKNICMIKPFLSYSNIATTRLYTPKFIPFIVAGAIKEYDMPDLMANFNKGKLLILDPVNAKGLKPTKVELNETYAFPEKVLNTSKYENKFEVYSVNEYKETLDKILTWLN